MDIEALCRETALHLFGDLRSPTAIQAGIRQVRPTVEFVAAQVRAEAKAELDRQRKRLLELADGHYLNWRAANRALARLHAEVGEREAAVRAEAVADERQATYERLLDAAQGAMNEERRLRLVQFVVNNFASVGVAGPVATPPEPARRQCAAEQCERYAGHPDLHAVRCKKQAGCVDPAGHRKHCTTGAYRNWGWVATPTEPRGVDAVAEARREGWMPFGTLVDVQLPAGRVVQFSDELDEGGLPLWERIRSAAAPLDAPRTFG